MWTNFNTVQNGTDSEHGASNGVPFIEIGSVFSEHGLGCIDFWWFWTNLVHLMSTNFNKIKNGTHSDHGASNGVSFIEIGRVVSEYGLGCIDFWWFWTNLVYLMWTNFNKIQNCTHSDHGASNGVSFIEIGSVVSEHGLPSNFWLHLYLEGLDRFSPLREPIWIKFETTPL